MDVEGSSLSRLDSSVGLGAEQEEEDAATNRFGGAAASMMPRRHEGGHDDKDDDEDEEDDPIVASLLSRAGAGAAGAGGEGGDAMSTLLAQYYGLAMDDPNAQGFSEKDEIDSAEFEAGGYVRRLLRNEGLESLLGKDDELVQEVKRLDSDMQMLVYENYSKFIAATDTIRRMKGNVEGMKAEMGSLAQNMEGIAGRMRVVNAFLAGKRAKVDQLVSVRRLLQRLDFLFALPTTLARCVQRGEYAAAVGYYAKAAPILKRHAGAHPSFQQIQRESDQIVAGLKDGLQKRLLAAATTPETTSPALLADHARLLLGLGAPRPALQAQVLAAYKARFAALLSQLGQAEEALAAKAAAQAQQQQQGPTPTPPTAAPATVATTGQSPFARHVSEAMGRVDAAFAPELEQGVQGFTAAFCCAGDGGQEAAAAAAARAELAAGVRQWVGQYVDIAKGLLRADLGLIAQGVRAGRCHDGQHYPLAALKRVLAPEGTLQRIHKLMPEVGALEQGRRLLQECGKGLLFLEFRGLQAWALKRLTGLQQALLKGPQDTTTTPAAPSPRALLDALLADTTDEVTKTLQTLQPALHTVEEEEMLHFPASGAVASASALPASLLAAQAVWQLVAWVADAGERMAGVTLRLTENDVIAEAAAGGAGSGSGQARRRLFPERFFAHASSASALLGAEQVGPLEGLPSQPPTSVHPPFVLLLAVLCRDLWTVAAPKLAAALQGIYPPPASPPATAPTPPTALALFTPEDCAACLHGSGMRLLQHFVEAQAAALAGVIKIHGLDAGGITAAGTGGGSIDDMRQTTWAKPVVLRLEALVHELGAALSVPVAGIGLGGGRRGERADHLLAASFAARAGASLSGRGLGADRGLERLFTVKVQVAAPVDLAVEPVLLAVLRAACKVLVERVRATTLSPRGYCQLQVDVQVLRMAVGAYVKDTAALEALLEEALISAGERTAQPLQGADVDMAQLSAVVNAEYSRLSAAIIMAAASSSSSGPASAAPVGVPSKPVTPGYRR